MPPIFMPEPDPPGQDESVAYVTLVCEDCGMETKGPRGESPCGECGGTLSPAT